MPLRPDPAIESIPALETAADRVGLSWLITVRWTTVLAGGGAVVAGRSALQLPAPGAAIVTVFLLWAASNVWLMWRVRARGSASIMMAGTLASIDVAVLSLLLATSGGSLNPASIFYLVQIVMAALVLGRRWTWVVTALSAVGYASLYAAPSDELQAALGMHREFGLHMRGMWLAFAVTALIIALLVTELAVAVERRDRALELLREKTARATRAAGMATLAAGAAHELGTPLSTIAVAARELERRLEDAGSDADLLDDARLIRAETDRCRRVLEDMVGESGQAMGETPRSTTMGDVVWAIRERLSAADRERLHVDAPAELALVWPIQVVARALCNIVQNALHASPSSLGVTFDARQEDRALIRLRIVDRGHGMSDDQLARAGEPFFTTKPAGKGTGLGLFVARSTIEQLGGRLSLVSRQGEGTTVSIVLPADVVTAGERRDA